MSTTNNLNPTEPTATTPPEPTENDPPPSPSAGSRTTDSFDSVCVANGAQSNIIYMLKAIIDEKLTGDRLREEIAVAVQIEDLVCRQIKVNGDQYRRIRHVFHDSGVETKPHATSTNEQL